jgi:hypothetical protein
MLALKEVHPMLRRLALTLTLVASGLLVAPVVATAADRWTIVIGTAAGVPQDVSIAAAGNNLDGWRGGGSDHLGLLAQGFEPTDHATLLLDVVEAGVFGPDGTPVDPGPYIAPGGELPARDFDVVVGETFFIVLDAYVVESNIPLTPIGATFRFMFTFDAVLGRTEQLLVSWVDFGAGLQPFLNEGLMMTNLRLRH